MPKRRKQDSDEDDENDFETTGNSTDIYHKKKKEKLKRPKGNDEKWVSEVEEEGLGVGEGGEEKEKDNHIDELPDSLDVRLAWTEEEMRTLVENIEKQLPKVDNLPYSRRIYKIDWDKVKFDPFSAIDCKIKFQEIISKQRTYRLCSEILHDIKEWVKKPWIDNSKNKPKRHPDMPPAPLSSYMLFCQEKKKKLQQKRPNLSVTEYAKLLGEMFNALPDHKKEKYRLKALEKREEYNQKLKEFYEKHPDAVIEKKNKVSVRKKKQVGPPRPLPPFKLFCESKIEKHKNDPDFDAKKMLLKCREQWKKLSDKKKAVWIKWTLDREQEYLAEMAKYVAEHPEFDNTTIKAKPSVLTKEDRAILDRASGKPKKPPTSAYSYFCSVHMSNDSFHNGQIRLKDLAERWKALPEVEKKFYAEEVKKLQEKYKEDFHSYLETLPEEKKLLELQNIEKSNQKIKNKTPVDKNQSMIIKWVEKKTQEITGNRLYKNEPPQPPGSAFDYFMEKFSEKHPSMPKDQLVAKAKLKWRELSDEKKNKYKDQLQALKKKFIKEYAAFLKNLNEKELAEYSLFKNKQQKSNSSDESVSSSSASEVDEDNEGDDDNEVDEDDSD